VDNGGNLIDCASIATVTALLHFRRPATTINGSEVTLHNPEDKEPVPLSIHHIPICITLGFFEEGEIMIVDPTFKEEQVMEGRMTITLNSHREICAVQKTGGTPLLLDQIIQCTRIAAVKVEEITELIQQELKAQANFKKNRSSITEAPAKFGPKNKMKDLPSNVETAVKEMENFAQTMASRNLVEVKQSVATFEQIEDESKSEPQSVIPVEIVKEKKSKDSDSEEEATVTLTSPTYMTKSKLVLDLNDPMEDEASPRKQVQNHIEPVVVTKIVDSTDLSLALKKKPKKKTKGKVTN